ncbi:hypothetical protein J5U22_02185 [Saccharolobus shibatae]|uniref:MFS transporter n=1 Tax=Saccharolobus shibatae TaxID=2286 RepID=A0A8F5GZR7_9CREN|nr:MFS transporter [Saccharolobus shibatae]QXJ35638.1 hypothetical protein J5U22_02185 [Saccharolobus shibatae]
MKDKTILLFYLSLFFSRFIYNFFYTTSPILAKVYYDITDFSLVEVYLYIFSLIGTFISFFLFRRLIFRLATFFVIISIIFIIIIKNPLLFYLSNAMAGFSFGIIIAYMLTIASFYGEKHLYLYSLVLGISTIVQPVVQTFIMLFIGFELLFIFYLALSLVLFIYSLIQRMKDKKEIFNLKLKVNYGIITSILITISYVTGFTVISTFLPVYLIIIIKHFSAGFAYSIFIPFFASTVLSRTLLSTIKIKNLKILSSLSIILTVLGFAILFEQIYIIDIIAAFILGISHGIIYPLASVYITRYSTANERNSYMSLYLLSRELSFSLIIFLFSFINLGTQLIVSIILNLILLLILLFLRNVNYN